MKVIDTAAGVREVCEILSKREVVTLDTEFERTVTYWPKLCLIQLAGEGDDEVFIIDPLAPGMDLKPFFDLCANEKVLKVLHAGRQDFEIFLHESGALPHPVFDTQVAAMVCGFGDSVGYDALARSLANVHIDKSSRFADWARRPLSNKQLDYAAGDVTHLRIVHGELTAMLSENERAPWLSEEMDILTDPRTYIVEPEAAWERLKTRSKNRRFLALVRELAAWRERTARTRDVTRNRVIRDDILMELAAHPPKTLDELKRVRKLPGSLSGPDREGILEALETGRQCPESNLPRAEKGRGGGQGGGPVVELLKVLLKARCESHGVAQRLVASVADLEQIAVNDKADVSALHGWRREVFGKDALELKQGRIGLSIQEGSVAVLPGPAG